MFFRIFVWHVLISGFRLGSLLLFGWEEVLQPRPGQVLIVIADANLLNPFPPVGEGLWLVDLGFMDVSRRSRGLTSARPCALIPWWLGLFLNLLVIQIRLLVAGRVMVGRGQSSAFRLLIAMVNLLLLLLPRDLLRPKDILSSSGSSCSFELAPCGQSCVAAEEDLFRWHLLYVASEAYDYDCILQPCPDTCTHRRFLSSSFCLLCLLFINCS